MDRGFRDIPHEERTKWGSGGAATEGKRLRGTATHVNGGE
eukprot:CAMPEP_0185019404 /NCGR_PEP_ID=MMETSP1103-20130426/2024_1 /TAXON_ID=36769 /ORGANISM="Paraphysomonas bandaiensis, Strain Caron Lab Isolate" /LENGTH=39 /DNA_ID= /DNA_START= /DNA_END= /DNA_ORIENTATION=